MQELIWLARCKLILVSSHWAWLLSWSPSAQSISRAPRSIRDWDERSHCDLHIIINLTTTRRCLVLRLFTLFQKYTPLLFFLRIFCVYFVEIQLGTGTKTCKLYNKKKCWFTNTDYYLQMSKLACVVCFACLLYVITCSLNVTRGTLKDTY